MYELPLFPLNTVLFPGAPMQLHIFEDRYKEMIDLCVSEQSPFGVVLIREGLEALGPLAEPYEVGCSARILNVQRLDQGRMNIVVLGQERFKIISTDRESRPYLMGVVESFPIQTLDLDSAAALAARLYPQVERFIRKLVEAGGMKYNLERLPDDPAALAYMAAAMLQISPTKKQALLVSDEVGELLSQLRGLYRRELALLEITLKPGQDLMQGGFSSN
jgi:Lon protease-like protein